jgi:alpha-D-ribose 1-methylphosphonate 5-triphosphate diphosphatase
MAPILEEQQTAQITQGQSEERIYENCRIILAEGIVNGGSLRIAEGKIQEISSGALSGQAPRTDCRGLSVMPGIIDLHSDALEKYIEPRPGTVFPMDIALQEFDKTLVSFGISTMYYCVAMVNIDNYGRDLRNTEMAMKILATLNAYQNPKANTKTHLRYDVLNQEVVPLLGELISEGKIDMLSFMDHTPGQGQFHHLENYKKRHQNHTLLSEAELDRQIEERQALRRSIPDSVFAAIAADCHQHGIALASHDDDSAEKIQWARSMDIDISEFPISLEVLELAHKEGMRTMVGAPNILLGGSHSGNLSALEALDSGYTDIICSDYSPMALFHSLFIATEKLGKPLPELVQKVSLGPAKALGIEEETGSIAQGKDADLVFFQEGGARPQIVKTLVRGQEVFSALEL